MKYFFAASWFSRKKMLNMNPNWKFDVMSRWHGLHKQLYSDLHCRLHNRVGKTVFGIVYSVRALSDSDRSTTNWVTCSRPGHVQVGINMYKCDFRNFIVQMAMQMTVRDVISGPFARPWKYRENSFWCFLCTFWSASTWSSSQVLTFHDFYKGVTVKESEISCWLVSPARRALKKICTLAQSWLKNCHQAHAQNGRLIFRI